MYFFFQDLFFSVKLACISPEFDLALHETNMAFAWLLSTAELETKTKQNTEIQSNTCLRLAWDIYDPIKNSEGKKPNKKTIGKPLKTKL